MPSIFIIIRLSTRKYEKSDRDKENYLLLLSRRELLERQKSAFSNDGQNQFSDPNLLCEFHVRMVSLISVTISRQNVVDTCKKVLRYVLGFFYETLQKKDTESCKSYN